MRLAGGTEHNLGILSDAGVGGVPCAHPQCMGRGGKWHTSNVRWRHSSAAPAIVVDEYGRPGPMDIAYSQCQDCAAAGRSTTAFPHTHPVVLERLKEAAPELLAALPFDPAYQFSDVFLHRVFTSILEYDTITRQGVSNVVEKVLKVGAETCAELENAYYSAGQVWWQQLCALAAQVRCPRRHRSTPQPPWHAWEVGRLVLTNCPPQFG